MTHENRTTRLVHSGRAQGIGGAALGGLFGILLRVAGMIPVGPIWLSALLGAAVGAAIFSTVTRAVFSGSEELAKQLTFPDAKGTYAPQYSHIQALEVQEKFGEALAAWLVVAEEWPSNPSPLLRAADLQLRHLGNAPAALELFERVRRMPDVRAEHVKYASQKIIDIHLAPGGDEGRALVELRRFIHAFPGGREAEGARAAIARIKGHTRDAGA